MKERRSGLGEGGGGGAGEKGGRVQLYKSSLKISDRRRGGGGGVGDRRRNEKSVISDPF